MLNYFIFKGLDSRDFGIQVGWFPEKIIPKKRMTSIKIDGRNGTLTETDNCFDSYPYPIECFCSRTDNISKIGAWLNGSGPLIKSDELDKVYNVKITNAISLNNIAEYWKNFIIQLEVEPINYSVEEYTQTINSSTSLFEIGGTVPTEPILEFTANGNVQITINNKNIILINVSGNIMIDTKLMIITQNGLNASNLLSGDLLSDIKLNPDNNEVDIIGFENITNFIIKYREANLC